MRICIVDLSGPFGPLRAYLALAPALARMGVSFDFVVPENSVEVVALVAPSATVHVAPSRHSARRDIGIAGAVRASVRAGADVVHANTTSAARGASLGVAGLGVPLVAHLRNSRLSARERTMLRVISKLHRNVRFIAVSEFAARVAGSAISSRSTVIMDPIPQVPTRPLTLSGSIPRIGVVVNQQPTKGFDVFAETAVRLGERSVHWEVFGSAGMEPPTNDFIACAREEIRRAGIDQRVTYHGVVPDLIERYKDLDVVLVTSRRESFSLVCAEAMLAGTPLVVPRIPGLLETIGGGALAATYRVADPEDAADAVLGVLTAYRDALTLAEEARSWALVQFDPESVARTLMEVYRDGPDR